MTVLTTGSPFLVVHPTFQASAWLHYCKLSLLTRNGIKPSTTQQQFPALASSSRPPPGQCLPTDADPTTPIIHQQSVHSYGYDPVFFLHSWQSVYSTISQFSFSLTLWQQGTSKFQSNANMNAKKKWKKKMHTKTQGLIENVLNFCRNIIQ